MSIELGLYNAAEYLRTAIAMRATFVNNKLEIHKGEAKAGTGMLATNNDDFVSRLYGGRITNMPHEIRDKSSCTAGFATLTVKSFLSRPYSIWRDQVGVWLIEHCHKNQGIG